MSDFAISSRVRSNLLDLITQTKTPISTDKWGKSPLDKRVNFFTAQGLSASDLNTFADAMATGINTIQAAHNGIVAITKLAQSAQVLVSHAQRIDDTTVRATLADQFDTLLVQIDRLARDAGCNGVNLLGGNDLTITMNEDGSSSLVVKSFNDTADGDLAINTSQNNWATNLDIQAAADSLKAAVVTLRLQGQLLSSSLSAIQIRQDFTKAMVNALQTGAENLTLADNSEEGATCLLCKRGNNRRPRLCFWRRRPSKTCCGCSGDQDAICHAQSDSLGGRGERKRMALKIELKPGERLILGGCLVTNGPERIKLLIEGNAPILREKDIISAKQANTPAKRIYLAVQLMYTARDPRLYHEAYFVLMRELVHAAPSAWPHIVTMNNHILAGEIYKALKSAKALIDYEKELIDRANTRHKFTARFPNRP